MNPSDYSDDALIKRLAQIAWWQELVEVTRGDATWHEGYTHMRELMYENDADPDAFWNNFEAIENELASRSDQFDTIAEAETFL